MARRAGKNFLAVLIVRFIAVKKLSQRFRFLLLNGDDEFAREKEADFHRLKPPRLVVVIWKVKNEEKVVVVDVNFWTLGQPKTILDIKGVKLPFGAEKTGLFGPKLFKVNPRCSISLQQFRRWKCCQL